MILTKLQEALREVEGQRAALNEVEAQMGIGPLTSTALTLCDK